MSQPNVLVTGGAGYIGSHTCQVLKNAGFVPVTYDNLSTGHREAVQWGPLEVGDISDGLRFDSVANQYKPVAIFHFAASIDVNESVSAPEKYYSNNTAGTLALLTSVVKNGVKNFVFSSTAAVYGEPPVTVIDETCPVGPINPYGRSKLMTELMLPDLAQAHGLKFVTLRYFNASGADPAGLNGSRHTAPTHLIPSVLDVARGKRAKLVIHGDDYQTRDGSCIRDYIHVTDLAEAHVAALKFLEHSGTSEVFNLGNGEGHSVKEVLQVSRKITGHLIPAEIGPRRPGDPACLIASSAKANRLLGWKPSHSDIQTIVRTAWDWMTRPR